MLRIRGDEDAIAVGTCHRGRAGTGFPGRQPVRQRAHGAELEQLADRQRVAGGRLQRARHADRKQGVAAEVEEIVVGADLLALQDLAPDGGQSLL
ncbi:hypothetical protein D3C72_1444540 [compost metagenome]